MITNFFKEHFGDWRLIFRYGVSGVTTAFVQFFGFYILFEVFGWWYVYAIIGSFFIAYFVGFSLQKYWTFKDNSKDRIYKQSFWYLIIAGAALFENILFMYILVDLLKFSEIPSQLFTVVVVSGISFILNKTITFKKKESRVDDNGVYHI